MSATPLFPQSRNFMNTTGSQGAQGAQGAQGDMGAQGFIGAQGAQGDMGPQGFIGAQGDMGPIGPIGPQGFIGAQGAQGDMGDMGPIGPIGPQGFIGAQGDMGPIGPIGPQGFIGAQGAQGDMGAQGNNYWTQNGTNIYNNNAGYVGVGTTDPQTLLDVNGIATVRNEILINDSINNTYIRIVGDPTNNYIQSAISTSLSTGKPLLFGIPGQATGATTTLYLDIANNKVGINKSPIQALDVNGNIVASGTITSGSDYRIKEEIKPLLLEEYSVDRLNPVYFKFAQDKKESIGLIAHELQEVYPFLVEGEKDGLTTQSVNYIGLIGILIREIQELKKEVKELKQCEN